MFLLDTNTVYLLSQAQHKKHQGKLRLDVSSQRLPQALWKLDDEAAREALGERVLRSLATVANEVVLQKFGWKATGPQPPAPDKDNLIRVLPSKNQFESYLIARLDQVMGLNRDNKDYRAAMANLAKDLYFWVEKEKVEAEAHRLYMKQQEVFIRCLPYPQEHKPLMESSVIDSRPVDQYPNPPQP